MFSCFARRLIALLNRTHLAVVPERTHRSSKRRETIRPQLEILSSRILPSVDIWTGANHNTDINWSDANNWSNGVPTSTSIVEFTGNQPDGNSIDDVSKTIAGLKMDGTWGATLQIGALNNPVTLTLASGSANEWDSGTIYLDGSDGTMINNGTLTLNGTGGEGMDGGGSFTNNGVINQTGAGNLDISGAGSNVANTFVNAAGATYDFQNNSSITNNGSAYGPGGFVINDGLIEKTPVNGIPVGASFITGSLSDNGGTFNAATGTLGFSGGIGDTNGTFQAAAGAILDLTGGSNVTLTENGTFTGSGNGSLYLDAGTLTTGSSGATFNIASTLAFDWSGGTISVPQNATLAYNGTLTILGSNGVELGGNGTFQNKGTINLTGAGNLDIGHAGNNSATTFINAANATFDFQNNSSITNNGSAYGPGGFVINDGLIEKTPANGIPVGTSSITGSLTNNAGTLNAATGTLALGGISDTNGTYDVAAGSTLDLTNGLSETGTFTAAGSGEILLDNGNMAATGSSGDTFIIPSTVSFQWTGGGFYVPVGATLTFNGTINRNASNTTYIGGGGTFQDNGTLNLMGGGYLGLYGNSNGSVATQVINPAGSTIDVQSGLVINSAGNGGGYITNAGTVEMTAGTGNTSVINLSLNNTGTISVASGTLGLDESTNDNNGTFNVGSGAILDLTSSDRNMTFTENGTFTAGGSGEILLDAGSVAAGASGATFTVSNTVSFQWTGGVIYIPVGATLLFHGTLNKNSTNTVYMGGGGTFQDSGTLNLIGGGYLGLYGNSNGSVATQVINPAGSTIDVQSGLVINSAGNGGGYITNAGTVEMTAGTGNTSVINLSLNNTGTISVASGTLGLDESTNDNNGTFTVAAGAILDLTDSDRTITFTENGTFTAGGSGEILLDAGALSAGASGATINLPNTVTFAWLGSYLNVPTGATLTLNGNLNLNGTSNEYLEGGGTMTENGTITQSNTGYLGIAGTGSVATTLVIPTGSVYDFTNNSGIYNAGGDGGVVNNSGTIEKTAGGASSPINVAFNNTGGTLNVTNGTLTLDTTGGENTGGRFTVSSGAILDLTGGNTVTYSGTYTGSGTGEVLLGSGILSVAGGSNGATFNLPGNLFVWSGGTIDTNGNTMTIEGNVKINSTNGSESLNSGNSTGGYLNIGGSSTGVLNDTAAGNTLNIASNTTLQITSRGTVNLADDTIQGGGALTNLGNLTKNTGTSGATISTYVDNEKNVTVDAGTLTFSGTVDQVFNNHLTGGSWTVAGSHAVATLDISAAGFNAIDPGVTVVLNGPYASFTNLSSLATNDGSLSLLGGASFATAGNFTNAGTLTLTPSSTLGSVLTVNGTFTQTSLGTLNIGIGGTASAPTFGSISCTGSATLAGKLKVTSTVRPSSGTHFDILTYSSESGDFTTKTLPSGWSAAPSATDYVVTV